MNITKISSVGMTMVYDERMQDEHPQWCCEPGGGFYLII